MTRINCKCPHYENLSGFASFVSLKTWQNIRVSERRPHQIYSKIMFTIKEHPALERSLRFTFIDIYQFRPKTKQRDHSRIECYRAVLFCLVATFPASAVLLSSVIQRAYLFINGKRVE
jgi:hypothetical protein